MEPENKFLTVCNWCCMPSSIIWVHGHGQCSVCGINIDECCQGEICDSENLSNNIGRTNSHNEK